MVAQIMLFALGFLIATLLALAVLPALNARAKRLAKQRVEALLPVSIDEVRVERDLIRAEGALAGNRKDQVIAKRGEALHKAMLNIAEKTMELEKLQAMVGYFERELAAARTQIAALEEKGAEAARGQAAAEEFERELAAARAQIATLEEKGAEAAGYQTFAEENARLSHRIEELADMLMAASEKPPASSPSNS